MLKNLFGLFQKSEKYYLELEPTQATPVAQTPTTTVTKTATPIGTKSPQKKKTTKLSNKVSSSVSFSTASTELLATSLVEKYRNGFADEKPVEFIYDSASIENAELAIKTAYKQVFGNAHLMESERAIKAESQFKNGEFGVREFIRNLAKSAHYTKLFWENCSNVTAIEFNFKHLLGRAPESYNEISQHIKILTEEGFEAEIDSYLDSNEYIDNFGEDFVPYYRGYNSPKGKNTVTFTHSFPLLGYACGSDKSTFGDGAPKLQTNLIQKNGSSIPTLRDIPESYPESYVTGVQRHIPDEYTMMARKLNIKIDQSATNINYADTISPSIAAKYGLSKISSNNNSSNKLEDQSWVTETASEAISAETKKVSQSSYSNANPYRRPVQTTKKFMDMARNIPQRLR